MCYFLLVPVRAARKHRKAPRRYRWSLQLSDTDPRVRALSPRGKTGLYYARELAENAAKRSSGALHEDVPERLTVEKLAREDDLSPVEINKMLRQTRIELFGKDLSDSAIYYRLRRDRDLGRAPDRPCAEPGCPRPLPGHASRRRRYCDFHLAAHARVSRFRARQKISAQPSA